MSGAKDYGRGNVSHVPIKRRPRFANGRAYVDKATKADEAAVRAAYEGPKFEGPVRVSIEAYKPLKSMPKGKAKPFVEKPDADNIAKAVMDGLNGVAYNDDAQVVELHVTKRDRCASESGPQCSFEVFGIGATDV